MQLDARLRAFAAVARQGSFSRAAAEIYVSQPAVSKHVAALEAELRTRLVERSRAGARLTPTGELLADYVLRAEALLANASRAVAAAADETAGTVKVVASGIPGDYLVPTLLPAFRGRHPRIHVDLEVTTSRRALELVRSHEAELAVVGGFDGPPELEFEPLLEDEIVLVGPPELAARRLRVADLERLVWVGREEGSSTRAAVEAARWQLGIHAVRALELTSWEAVKRTVIAGGGVAAISRVAVEHELAAGALAVLDVPRWRVRRTLSIATARDVPLTPAVGHFREALRELTEAALAPSANDASEDESALARLGVFANGFAADAAEYVCDVDYATLVRLAGRGVLERNGRRFSLTREESKGVDDDVARRHAEFFASLVAESESRLTHLGQDEWTSRLRDEQPNIDAAVRWAGGRGDRALQLRLLGRCWQLWLQSGCAADWRQVLEDALPELDEPRHRLLALAPLAWIAYDERDLDRAEALANERLELARSLQDGLHVAGASSLLGALAEERGDLKASRALHEEAVDVDRRSGDDVGLMRHLHNLSILLVDSGDLVAAEAALHEEAAIARGRGDDEMRDQAAELLAMIALLRDLPARALDLARDSFTLRDHVRREDYWGTVELAGAALVGVGRPEIGARLLAASEELRKARGVDRQPALVVLRSRALEQAAAALGDAALARETRRGEKLRLEEALELARGTTPAPSAARRSSAQAASRSSSSRARRARR